MKLSKNTSHHITDEDYIELKMKYMLLMQR